MWSNIVITTWSGKVDGCGKFIKAFFTLSEGKPSFSNDGISQACLGKHMNRNAFPKGSKLDMTIFSASLRVFKDVCKNDHPRDLCDFFDTLEITITSHFFSMGVSTYKVQLKPAANGYGLTGPGTTILPSGNTIEVSKFRFLTNLVFVHDVAERCNCCSNKWNEFSFAGQHVSFEQCFLRISTLHIQLPLWRR